MELKEMIKIEMKRQLKERQVKWGSKKLENNVIFLKILKESWFSTCKNDSIEKAVTDYLNSML